MNFITGVDAESLMCKCGKGPRVDRTSLTLCQRNQLQGYHSKKVTRLGKVHYLWG